MKMMMYRRCTTTGMNKKKIKLPIWLWFFITAGSRVLYFWIRRGNAADTYGYFEEAMIRTGRNEAVFRSGLSHAFIQAMSGILRFTGNIIDMACVWQMVMQILWIMLFLAGISMIFGKAAGLLASGIFILSPWTARSVFVISPENYYMLHLSLLLVMLGFVHDRNQNTGWCENFWHRTYLSITGLFLGIVCVWNYSGWILAVLMVYIQASSYRISRDRAKKDERFIGPLSQSGRLTVWFGLGMCAAWMRHTGFTGLSILQQVSVWISQLWDVRARCIEVSGYLMFGLMAAFITGIVCRFVSRKAQKPEKKEEVPMEEKKDVPIQEQGKVKLLDNPLPVPKKHVKREIRFDVDDVKLEFDISISEDDDFDI